MDPSTIDPTSQSMETGITTIEQADAQANAAPVENPTVSAKDALGLDEAPSDSLRREAEKTSRNVPEDKVATKRDSTGKFASKDPSKAAAKPSKTTPTTAAVEAPKPVEPTKPAEPPAPQKIKIGDKEYTVADLEKALKERQAPAKAAERTAPEPTKEPEKTLSADEISAMEMKFVQDFSKSVGDIPVSEDQLEKILVGGKEGVTELVNLLKTTSARAALETRKSIYAELNPHIQTIVGQLTPLVEHNAQIERFTVENMFTTQFPEYQGELLGTAKMVAEELVRQYPQITSQYTREQFVSEVDRQASRIIGEEFKRWNPNYQGTWKDYAKMQKASQPSPSVAPAPAPVPQVAAPAQAAKPSAKPAAKPPASNSPHNMTGGTTKEWGKSVASTLVD